MTQDRPSASVREWSIGARGRDTGAQDDDALPVPAGVGQTPGQVAGEWRTDNPDPRPAAGGEEPAGGRQLAGIGSLVLESGDSLPGVVIAYETWGRPNAARDNAVLICHALTGDAHVVGPAGPGQPTPGWWDGLIGPGRSVDPADWYVVAANVLGGCQGSTGPSSPAPDGKAWGSRFPAITVRDQVAAEAALSTRLGIDRWAAVIGGSMGGMRALEWLLLYPERVATSVVLASTGYATAEQIAWCAPQLAAIEEDPAWQGGDYYGTGTAPTSGLGIARQIAHITYRSEYELASRFGRKPQGDGRFAVESYLDHHATKLVNRFDAGSYAVLTRAMNSHDIGRDRGGLRQALENLTGRLVIAAVDSDRLYPARLSAELVEARPDAGPLHLIKSPYGHDGFLIELEQVGALIADTLGS
ncbi:homoserine O-acetyltransferase [Kribbella voronezhensis]|uniref:Homoserine O-acetyltransferase n=1 Tax=Kribbella voronezhensis TaxID=2512212 RepID=A0A4R7TB46_9ACTN|nr:homoserine O-acetyltransferase [Kribbella voronezhensis]TDU88487.1 homoserine O-acetyltransferase [Kribbella voronezhensis]